MTAPAFRFRQLQRKFAELTPTFWAQNEKGGWYAIPLQLYVDLSAGFNVSGAVPAGWAVRQAFTHCGRELAAVPL
jgi:hypothetical protein